MTQSLTQTSLWKKPLVLPEPDPNQRRETGRTRQKVERKKSSLKEAEPHYMERVYAGNSRDLDIERESPSNAKGLGSGTSRRAVGHSLEK